MIAKILLAIFSIILSLSALEVGLRLIDGYSMTTLELGLASVKAPSKRALDGLMEKITFDSNIDPELIHSLPPPILRGSPPEKLVARVAVVGDMAANYVWNENYVASTYFDLKDTARSSWRPFWFRVREPIELSMFAAPWGSIYPRFRFQGGVTLPSGLVTNRHGWRGRDVELAKPSRMIRLAAVG